jgi:hypothetical protein
MRRWDAERAAIALVAMTVAITAPAFGGTDPHAPAKAAAPKPAAPAAPAAPAPKQAPNSLVEVHDRIQTRVAEVAARWKKAPAAAPRQAPAPVPVPPRVRVVWRAAVSWPAALSSDTIEAEPVTAVDRIPVSWTPPPAGVNEAPPAPSGGHPAASTTDTAR